MADSFSTLVGRVAGEFADRRRRGETPSVEEYAARHPDHADALREVLPLLSTPRPEESVYVTQMPSESLAVKREDVVASVPGYEILGELGRGGMGVVYKARQVALGRVVALKMVLSGSHAGDDEVRRFRGEAEAIARLSHPGIVQVYEVGDAGGQPYFALEFVEGGSLADRLGGTPLPGTDAARLARRLAEAIAAAHAAGVVHRDLKPANVLLSSVGQASSLPGERQAGSLPYDEPKVTDFGLAKKLDAPGLTQSGAVVGTPSYMAPEQARGEPAGPSADVWSLGAILYECLTGRPPFRAASVYDTLAQVIGEEPAAPRSLNAQAPRDLETIALKCLQKDPSRRYASAQALSDDLGRYLDGRPILARPVGVAERLVKSARRHPAVASLLAVLALVVASALVISLSLFRRATREADAAVKQRDQAEANLALARKAVDDCFLLAREDPFMQSDGMRTFRRILLSKSLPFYQNFVALSPDDAEARMEVATQHYRIGYILEETEDKKVALAELDKATALLRPLIDEYPAEPQYLQQLCLALGTRGLVQGRLGRLDDADASFREGRELGRRLVALDASNRDYARDLAGVCVNYSSLLNIRGKLAESLAASHEARDALAPHVARRPYDDALQAALAMAVHNAGVVERQMGRFPQAYQSWRAAVAIRRKLVAARPEVGAYQEGLGQSLTNLGILERDAGQAAAAVVTQREAVGVLRGLAAAFPANTSYQFTLGQTLHNLANAESDAGRRADAAASYEAALTLRRRLVASQPGVVDYQIDLAKNLDALANQYAELGRQQAAATAHREAVGVAKAVARANPGVAEAAETLGRAWYNLGGFLDGTGEPAAAASAYSESVRAYRASAKINPGDIGPRLSLANACCNLAIPQAKIGRQAEALANYDEAVTIQRELAKAHPAATQYSRSLAITLLNRGGLRRDAGKPAGGLADLDEAAALAEPLMKAGQLSPEFRRAVLVARANTLGALGRHADAAAEWAKAEPLVPERFRSLIAMDRAEALEKAGLVRDAAGVATQAGRRKGAPPEAALRAARCLARCSVEKRHGEPLAVRERRAEAYAQQAVELLRVAEIDRDGLDAEKDFAPLRPRADFQALRAGLEK